MNLKKNVVTFGIYSLASHAVAATNLQDNLNIPNTGVPTQLSSTELPPPLAYGWDNRRLQNGLPRHISQLPMPGKTKHNTKKLSIHEAILLALRYNTDIINNDIDLISSRFSYETSMNAYMPQISDLQLAYNYASKQSSTTLSDSTITLKTRQGTQYTLGLNHPGNLTSGKTNYYFNVSQPLIRGFGMVADISYQQAKRNYQIALMSYKSRLINSVESITNGYWGLVQALLNYQNTLNQFNDSKITTQQTELKYKAGQATRSAAIEAKANLNSSKNSLISSKQSLQETYTNYLQTLGLNIYSKINLDLNILEKKRKLPSLKSCIEKALKNNISYRIQLLQLKTSQEAIIAARDARHWKLDLTAGYHSGTRSASGKKAPISAGLNLTIPINDIDSQNTLIGARIAYEKAKISAQQAKIKLITDVTQTYRNIQSNKAAIRIARAAANQSQEVLNNSKLKLRFGKSTMFEVTTNQNNLLAAQTSLVKAEISYLQSVQTLHNKMSDTLTYWGVKMRNLDHV